MVIEAALLLLLSTQAAGQATAPTPAECGTTSAVSDTVLAEICIAENMVKQSDAAREPNAQRRRQFEAAAEHYKRAVARTSEATLKTRGLKGLASVYDEKRLNDPAQLELVLRDLIAVEPTVIEHLFTLAAALERAGNIDGAEDLLISARRRQADQLEPYKKLAQFYSRRAAALQPRVKETFADNAASGAADDNGVYKVGAGIPPPGRVDIAKYPPEAKAAGITGVVTVEVLIDESGTVKDAKVVRSIPLLDDEALRAVRQWKFAPTIIGGVPVPVRMNVAVSFANP